MKYEKTVILKDGRECLLRNGDEKDAAEMFDLFNLTHAQTDFLLSYPEENSFTVPEEAEFLKNATESPLEIELMAFVDGKAVGSAGFAPVGKKYKVRHRAEFGISVDKDYWGLGIGNALISACIELAKSAGFEQMELDVIGDNRRAISLYEKYGFREYGRNPKGFNSRYTGFQELVLMRLEL